MTGGGPGRGGAAVPLAEIVSFLDVYLDQGGMPDYPQALNGLQVAGAGPVRRVAVAVDASEAVIRSVSGWADLLIVHHGLFWGGLRPLTGPHFRRVRDLIESGTALYSSHLPLDAHPEVGNSVLLARALGLGPMEPFGEYKGAHIGWKTSIATGKAESPATSPQAPAGPQAPADPRSLADRLEAVLGTKVHVLPGGPSKIRSVGIVTGSGAPLLAEAASQGLDALITGEAQHHHAIEAAELGVTVFLGGHYATETWGVRAVGDLLTERFGVEARFVDFPTGM